MMQGRVIKNISNHYVINDNNHNYEAMAMGKIRLDKAVMVGDNVEFDKMDDRYMITKILPRKNELKRPPIANVDQAIIVMSAVDPDFSTTLIDRLIFVIAYASIKPLLCVTKLDLVSTDSHVYGYIQDYKDSGYEVYTSGKDFSTEAIEDALTGKVSILTGQSGAGKSTLINRIDERFDIKTQKTSKALGRGKHTTRHSELYAINGGWLGDTPGFSSLDFDNIDITLLAERILDFKDYQHHCRFNNCIHLNEPGCAVKAAVEKGAVVKYRYQHYCDIVNNLKNQKKKY